MILFLIALLFTGCGEPSETQFLGGINNYVNIPEKKDIIGETIKDIGEKHLIYSTAPIMKNIKTNKIHKLEPNYYIPKVSFRYKHDDLQNNKILNIDLYKLEVDNKITTSGKNKIVTEITLITNVENPEVKDFINWFNKRIQTPPEQREPMENS